jgi:hypothetical protein
MDLTGVKFYKKRNIKKMKKVSYLDKVRVYLLRNIFGQEKFKNKKVSYKHTVCVQKKEKQVI